MAVGDYSLLVIDSEDAVRNGIASHLQPSGFRVHQASDGPQGLDMFKQCRPDVVICDPSLLVEGGNTVLKAITSLVTWTPIIVLSANDERADVVQALRVGARDYLIKPIVDMALLDFSIERCLDQAKLLRDNRHYRRKLEAANLELKQNLQVLEQDQQAGRHIQLKMLPEESRKIGDYHFSHKILPSLYLSGDCVDYFTVGEHHVVYYIADVSGHGASSAFVTVLLKNLFARKRSDLMHRDDSTIMSPVKMLERANRELLDTGIGKHATMCVGILDLRSGELRHSIAGHLPVPVLTVAGQSEYLAGEGVPIGLFEDAEFSENTLQLPDEFVLSLFSDGILELLPVSGVLEQEQFLLNTLQAGHVTTDAVIDTLGLTDVKDAPDDIAVLLIVKA